MNRSGEIWQTPMNITWSSEAGNRIGAIAYSSTPAPKKGEPKADVRVTSNRLDS